MEENKSPSLSQVVKYVSKIILEVGEGAKECVKILLPVSGVRQLGAR